MANDTASNPPPATAGRLGSDRSLLPRSQLIRHLDSAFVRSEQPELGFSRRLTLVCAPPGFGKTTAIDLWLSALSRRAPPPRPLIIHLGINRETGSDPDLFASSLSEQFHRVAPDNAWDIPLGGMPLQPVLINRLLAAINRLDQTIILVLDDYHLATHLAIHEFMGSMLERLPENAHLVVISRSDPPFMVARLRVAGQLTELRARDLRLTSEEATAFLNELRGLDLRPAEVALLEQRTEGWIAGLQLAAYSLSLQEDRAAFLSAFTGDDRYIADYLIEEVLQRQTPDRLSFMLKSSILDRLSAELCEAVTGRSDSRALLQSLEADNLFLTPLDNRRQWYRFHRLFADLLHERLLEQGETVHDLHRRAANWFQTHGYLPEAIDHALAGADWDLATDLMILIAPELFQTSRLSRLARWGDMLPVDALQRRPRLILALGWAWLATGHPDESRRMLGNLVFALGMEIERLCEPEFNPDGAIQAALIEASAIQARILVDQLQTTETMTMSRCALGRLDTLVAIADDWPILFHSIPPAWPPYFNSIPSVRPVVLFNMALALKFENKIDQSGQVMATASALARKEGNSHLVALADGHLAGIQRIQGRPQSAKLTCERGLAFLKTLSAELSPLAGLLLVEHGSASYDLGQLGEAEALWLRGIELAEPWGNWETLLPGYLGLARLRAYRGDPRGALDALDSLTALTPAHQAIVDPVVHAYRNWIASVGADHHGQAANTGQLSGGRSIALPYLRELEVIVNARALISRGQWAAAAALLETHLSGSETDGRFGHLLEIRLLQSLAYHRIQQPGEADKALELALQYALPEELIQPFLETGHDLLEPLDRVPPDAAVAPFARRMRGLIAPQQLKPSGELVDLGPDEGLVERLSEREAEVLACIAAGMSNKDIADRLFVTEGTVKNHAHSIYGKLGVAGRTQAIIRGRQLGLIEI